MLKNNTSGSDPIQPIYSASGNPAGQQDVEYINGCKIFTGLTKREHFAAMAMQGICANPTTDILPHGADIAKYAVECADFLITELNKPTI